MTKTPACTTQSLETVTLESNRYYSASIISSHSVVFSLSRWVSRGSRVIEHIEIWWDKLNSRPPTRLMGRIAGGASLGADWYTYHDTHSPWWRIYINDDSRPLGVAPVLVRRQLKKDLSFFMAKVDWKNVEDFLWLKINVTKIFSV